jgi:2-C-methyl-D-erythritol 2,4-cyclodiphosphate synthase
VTGRVGMGFDVHAFSDDPDRRLVLGGVWFEGERGLIGHSPDTDPAHAGADSCDLLATVVAAVQGKGWTIANIDCSVVCEAPKLAPRRDAMQDRLSAVVGSPVTVKGRRAEGLGALGRREGIACWAVALLE